MPRSFAGQILHVRADAPVAEGRDVAVRVDHVLVREDDGPLVFAGFAAIGATRIGCDCAIACLEQEPAGPDAADDARALQSAALTSGAHFVRAGSGPAAAVYRRGFAAPGRLLLSAVPGIASAGGAGTLALSASAPERSIALAGIRHALDVPPILGVRPEGAPAAGLGADDALDALARAFEAHAHGAIVEFAGPGVAALPVALRLEIARLAPLRLGALACLFTSDERLRGWMRARGRESEWRRHEGGTDDLADCHVLALGGLRPCASLRAGEPVNRVVIGPLAEDADVRAFTHALAPWSVAGGVACDVTPGGRAGRRALSDDGGDAALERAGARLLEAGAAAPASSGPAGAVFALGESDADARALHASASACAAAARTGRVPSPSELLDVAERDEPIPAALIAGDVLEPVALADESAGPPEGAGEPLALGAPFDAPVRGVVLLVLGDDVTCDRVLPWGPRAHAARGRAAVLAELAFRAFDPALAARAQACGGGLLVAGHAYGGGEPGEPVARATAALGVRTILAVSFAAGHRVALAQAGVLALSWARPDDARTVAAGDELEIAGLPEALAPHRPLEVRNLTRGLSYGAHHHLAPRVLDIARAGGLLRTHARAVGSPAGGFDT